MLRKENTAKRIAVRRLRIIISIPHPVLRAPCSVFIRVSGELINFDIVL
jgi:hypothetical protein